MLSGNALYLLDGKCSMKFLWHSIAGNKVLGPLIETAKPGTLSKIYRSH